MWRSEIDVSVFLSCFFESRFLTELELTVLTIKSQGAAYLCLPVTGVIGVPTIGFSKALYPIRVPCTPPQIHPLGNFEFLFYFNFLLHLCVCVHAWGCVHMSINNFGELVLFCVRLGGKCLYRLSQLASPNSIL